MSDTNVTAPAVESTPAPATQGSSPAAATPAAPAAPAASATSTPAAPQAPATGAPGEGWVPSYRLREASEKAERTYAEQMSQFQTKAQAEIERLTNQVRALTGTIPPNPQTTEQEAIKAKFYELFPNLRQLEERADDLLAVSARAEDLDASANHYWQSYGRQNMDKLYSLAEQDLGAPLTEEGKRSLHAAFTGFVSSSPEMTQRYAQDPTLVEEYWKGFTSSFISPARRVASAAVAGRTGTALPQDTGGSVPPVSPGPKPGNLDDRAATAWALYQQNKK